MTNRRFTFEHGIYALALALALLVRFLKLGALPLSDYEATWALQAFQIADGARPALGPHPAYILLTSITFFIFGASNFLARFWPALTGSLLALAPFFFRDRLGRLPALILAFALALDPGLLALSRLAGSSAIMALTFLVLAWAMWRNERHALAGVFGGLALLSGPSLCAGLLALGLTWAIGQVMASNRRPATNDKRPATNDGRRTTDNGRPTTKYRRWTISGEWKTALGWGAGTLLLGGTLLVLSPNGLSALAASLPAYVQGWWMPSGVSTRLLLIALPAYELMALAFGLVALVRGWLAGDRQVLGLGLWTLVALLLALAYPAHQVGDLAWMLPSLWALAVLALSRYLVRPAGYIETGGAALLTMIILIFVWFDLAGIALDPASPMSTLPTAVPIIGTTVFLPPARYLILIGALLFLTLCHLLISLGWSPEVSRLGAAWGSAAALVVFTLGMALGAAGLRRPATVELWQLSPQTAQADILLQAANEISNWRRGHVEALDLTIAGVNSPALRWLFRDWTVREEDVLPLTESPSLAITPQGMELSLPASYRGQDFVWRQAPVWNSALYGDWLHWFVFREMPRQTESIILWVRNDLFFDSEAPRTSPPPQERNITP